MEREFGFGVDIGGTSCKIGLFDKEGNLLEKWQIHTHRENCGEGILRDVAESVIGKMKERTISGEQVIGIGVGIPGPVSENGKVGRVTNIEWDQKDVAGELRELTGLMVRVGNDANVAALGEYVHGSGQGRKSLIMITLGTGVGGGVVMNGRIIHGANGAGGEIGHIKVSEDEIETCGCGKTGCLEQYASATGIVRMAKNTLRTDSRPTILKEEGLTAKDVFDAARQKDELAMEIVERVGKILGKAIADVASILDPSIIVLGGGVSKAGDVLVDVVTKYYRKYTFHACENTPIVEASLGNDAGIYGCMGMLLTE